MTWIVTNSGKKFDYLNPNPESIVLRDIAIALSRIPRFTGHAFTNYTVLDHVINGLTPAVELGPEVAVAWLLHDASEAYMMDIATPLKDLLPEYKKIEARLQSQIEKAFGYDSFSEETVKAVKDIDLRIFCTECHQVFNNEFVSSFDCLKGVVPYEMGLRGASPGEFIRHFETMDRACKQLRKKQSVKPVAESKEPSDAVPEVRAASAE